jgi:hypothetical protein
VAVKPGGAFLYAYVGGAFHQLFHDPRAWSTGDVLRVEVRTIAASTARLTVLRNGAVLFTHDDAAHFIADGQPGIGLWASAAVALDDWAAGEAAGSAPPDPSEGLDDFNRAPGDLGPNWTGDPVLGAGLAIMGNQVSADFGQSGAAYWSAGPGEADQYAQVRLTGTIGDWVGVVVRASTAPSQGYWLAVKPGGAFLYAYVGGAFYQLAHDPTLWSTGDVLRVEVRTIAPNTARLTVLRNGAVLFTHDDAAHFIADGQPGIGLWASAAIALDDWATGIAAATP